MFALRDASDRTQSVVPAVSEKKLMSMDEWNASRRKRQASAPSGQTGIACPRCNAELVNPTPGSVLLSDPLQIRVACTACGCRGFAFA